jgi:hypothetical protein
MTINQIITKVRNSCDAWIQSEGGKAYVASGFFDCWEFLSNKPGSAKIGVYAVRGTPRNNFPQGSNLTRREDEHFKVVISRGRGLQSYRSANLTDGSSGGRPLYDLLDDLRMVVMNILFDPITTERPHEYLGWSEWGKEQGVDIDAYELNFSIGNQLPMPSATPMSGNPV